VWTQQIPAAITSQNRLLLAEPVPGEDVRHPSRS
jgi:hypothetical protein